ncbi:MAG: hypothetical protein QXQ39_06735 [Conexivisphaerales archaeon]
MTKIACVVKKGMYRDSMRLLKITEEVKKMRGIVDASIVMGTPTNKELLDIAGLLTKEAKDAGESDMIISVLMQDNVNFQDIINTISTLIEGEVKPASKEKFSSIEEAFQALPDAKFAIVSIAGEYAFPVVKELLDKGLHVQLFSDHVPLKDEVELKKYAVQRGLFLLGPGAGTSIIGGIGLGFANAVKRGDIGIVAAAGTGLQEVSSILSNIGSGISQGMGVGGGDVKDGVGGIMSLAAIHALEEDPATRYVCFISKPPDAQTLAKIENFIESSTKKKYVLCFLGSDKIESSERIKHVRSLHSAAAACAKLQGADVYNHFMKNIHLSLEKILSLTEPEYSKINKGQSFVRGLYTGGTLSYESQIIISSLLGNVFSNAPLDKSFKLKDSFKSFQNTIVDLGEEEFTKGRAHPMIDPTVRRLRLLQEAKDESVACIALDFVLGYGANSDPVGSIIESIKNAKEIASTDGRYLPILAHVCGTDNDPQGKTSQERMLKDNGVLVFNTNAQMALAGAIISSKGELSDNKLKYVFESYMEAS